MGRVITFGELQANFELREDLLLAVATGTVSYQSAYSLLERVLDTAKQGHVSRIVVDTLAVQGTLSPENRYELGRVLAEYVALGTDVKMAFVGKPTDGLGVMVAQNRGVRIEMFSTRYDTLIWLDAVRSLES